MTLAGPFLCHGQGREPVCQRVRLAQHAGVETQYCAVLPCAVSDGLGAWAFTRPAPLVSLAPPPTTPHHPPFCVSPSPLEPAIAAVRRWRRVWRGPGVVPLQGWGLWSGSEREGERLVCSSPSNSLPSLATVARWRAQAFPTPHHHRRRHHKHPPAHGSGAGEMLPHPPLCPHSALVALLHFRHF